MATRVLAGAIVAAVLMSAGLASSAAAQGVGAIGGTVSDSSGAALPGVTVSLSNPGVIGGDQSTVTDERGAYQFTRLVPGNNYAVKTALQGFRSALQERIVVNSDTTTRVDLHLEIGALEETITVSSQSPLLDTTQTLKQTVMTRETLDVLPSRSDVWAIARTAPAVVMNKYDVGGSEMFSQSFAADLRQYRQRAGLHDRRHGRHLGRRRRVRDQLPRRAHVRRGQPADRERVGGVGQGRLDHQHGHQDRQQPVARLVQLQRRRREHLMGQPVWADAH